MHLQALHYLVHYWLYVMSANIMLWKLRHVVDKYTTRGRTQTAVVCLDSALNHWVKDIIPFSSVQSLSCVQLFATPWITGRQASLSITNSRSLPKFMSIESVMPSSHLILCHPVLLLPPILPSIRVFSNESSHEVAKVLDFQLQHQNTQDWPPLGWTGWISLQSKGLSRIFSNTTV